MHIPTHYSFGHHVILVYHPVPIWFWCHHSAFHLGKVNLEDIFQLLMSVMDGKPIPVPGISYQDRCFLFEKKNMVVYTAPLGYFSDS